MPEPNDEFTAQLRQVLNHLYDYAYLQNHRFGEWLSATPPTGSSRSQLVRQAIIDAIEQLHPGTATSPRSAEARSYQILVQRYVEAQSPGVVSAELGITERQLYRDQKAAVAALASILWQSLPRESTEDSAQENDLATSFAQGANPLESEVNRIQHAGARETLSFCDLVGEAIEVAQNLGESRGVPIDCSPAQQAIMIDTNRTLVRQALFQIVGDVFSCHHLAEVRFDMTSDASDACLELSVSALAGHERDTAAFVITHIETTRQILRPMEGRVAILPNDTDAIIELRLPLNHPTLLVIEDNQDAIQLVRRYLADQPYRIVGADSGEVGLTLAYEVDPAVILIDLMIPDRDGWELLQMLRADTEAPNAPVVVCSVLPQESLALALGASAYLRKPFTRQDLLDVLAAVSAAPRQQ